MKFLVDAHLPRRLAYQLRAFGHEAVHTLDLPRGKRTPDPVRWGLPGEYQVPWFLTPLLLLTPGDVLS